MLILGIETSCDETAAAVVKDGRIVLSDIVFSQADIHAKYGGVVPEVASRHHVECVSQIVKEALDEAGVTLDEIDAIAVTYAPGLIGALLVGVNFAKALAVSRGKTLIPVHHIRGHVAANYIDTNLEPPFLSVIVSGGHTTIVEVKDYCSYEIIARTRDDAAGEAFDKIARVLGLGYPGGAVMDKAAQRGMKRMKRIDDFKLPSIEIKDNPFDMSFSGLKTAAVNLIHNMEQKGEEIDVDGIAAAVGNAVTEMISIRLDRVTNREKYRKLDKIALAGGVAANSMLREKIKKICDSKDKTLYIPQIRLCGDNAVMIAAQGYYEYTQGNKANADLNAYAVMSV